MGSARKKLIEAAQVMVSGRPDEATQLGQLAAAVGEQTTDLWQENVATVEVFAAMLTQWNVGPSGIVGLRYEALPAVMAMAGVPRAGRTTVFEGLRVMEHAALEALRDGG